MLLRSRSTDVLTHAFKHALVRDVAYSSLLKKAQASLHARIAKVLVEDFPETGESSSPSCWPSICEAAGEIDQAVHYLVKAARLSAKRSGFVEAIAQLERGLALLATQPKSSYRTRQELHCTSPSAASTPHTEDSLTSNAATPT